jgi:hypothetical protein
VQGICICSGNWIGAACDIAIRQSNTSIDTTSPQANVSVAAVTFTIAFSEVREVTSSGKTVKSFPVALSTISSIRTESNGTTSWNYSVPLTNGAYILACFSTVDDTKIINFANKSFALLPNVLKSSITIFNYPFTAYTNKLNLVFSLGSNTTSANQVSSTDGQIQMTTSDGHAQYASYTMGGTRLVAKFLSFGVVDGASIVVQTSIDVSKNQFLMSLPRFSSHGMVDPDFAISNPNEPSSEEHRRNNKATIAGMTLIAVLVGGLVVAICIFGVYKKRSSRRNVAIDLPPRQGV